MKIYVQGESEPFKISASKESFSMYIKLMIEVSNHHSIYYIPLDIFERVI